MSRRRRLALRQIEEPEATVALSDAEDDANGYMQSEAHVAEPNFSLLPGMMMNIGSTPEAPVVLIDSEDDAMGEHAPTQLVSSPSQEQDGRAAQPAKKPRIENAGATVAALPSRPIVNDHRPTAEHPKGIFQLYQTGLCADHTLRLHYIRRRPPAPQGKRVEDEFVLPRPRLSLLDMLPPRMISFKDVLVREELTQDHSIVDDSMRDLDQIIVSAQDHWRQLAAACPSTTATWRVLQIQEWTQIYNSSSGFVPAAEDLTRVLQALRSDAFASFVWKELLPATIRQFHSTKATATTTLQQLASALLSHTHFSLLPAKDFRAQLRDHKLRAIDASFGAHVELMLVTMFHQIRNSDS